MWMDAAVLAAVAALIFWGCRRERVTDHDKYMVRMNQLRGLFALEIVIGHVVRDSRTILYPLGKMMIISVAFFFFVSGYGLAGSFYRKERYLASFPRTKLLYLFLLAVSAYIVSCGIEALSGSFHWYLPDSIRQLPATFAVSVNWYIWEQLLWYVLFALIYGLLPRKWRTGVAFAVGFAVGCVFFFAGFEQKYYCSILGFPAGLCFYEYREQILKFFAGWVGKVLTAAVAAVSISCLFMPEDSFLGMMILRNLLCLSAVSLVTILVGYVRIGNPVSSWLGKISPELYLMQFPWLLATEGMQEQYLLRMAVVLTASIVSAAILHRLNDLWRVHLKGNTRHG